MQRVECPAATGRLGMLEEGPPNKNDEGLTASGQEHSGATSLSSGTVRYGTPLLWFTTEVRRVE
jgi:hypothetical protein